MVKASRLLRYGWAAPYTVLGVALGFVAVLCGGHWRTHRGVIEVFGGGIGLGISGLPPVLGFSAMTLGHVILAVDRSALSQLRLHEHVHVRQYERLGALFFPLYVGSSVVQLLRGRDPYFDNRFEREARALADR